MPDLPDNIEQLNRLLTESRKALAAATARLRSRDLEIEALKLQLAVLKRLRFDRSSEQLDVEIAQLQLALDTITEAEVLPVETQSEHSDSPWRGKPARWPLLAHLPPDVQSHDPGRECPDCGGALKPLGEDITEILDYVRGRFKVIREVRPKLSCGRCARIVLCAAPSRPIARGRAGPGLLAHVLTSKYADHLTLYRQSKTYAREGRDLNRSTFSVWVAGSSRTMAPLVRAVGRYFTGGDKVHVDDTPVPLLDLERGESKTGRLWTYVRDDRPAGSDAPPAVWFRYCPSRHGKHPSRHLCGFKGLLQADAFASFNGLYAREPDPLEEVAGWVYVRRKLCDLHATHGSPLAKQALERICTLYRIEGGIRGQPPDERRAVREGRASPSLNELYTWLEAIYTTLSKKSGLALAIHYALARWPALTRYCGDGRRETDNCASERPFRPVPLGRKNYLFAGSYESGERAAAIYRLLGTAKLNGLDPQAYLRLVLERIAKHPVNRIVELLPSNLASDFVQHQNIAA